MKNSIFLLLAFVLCCCCTQKQEVDLIVVNANIYTVDETFSKAEAFAVHKGAFVAVGATDEILKEYNANKVVDVKGKTITPGLIDAHCHFYGLGLKQQVVDLVGTTSYSEVLERVRQFQKENRKQFIVGSGWDQNDWRVKEFPTKKELDSLYPNTPVALRRIDGHAYLVNTKAMEMAEINEGIKLIGGEIVKDKSGITGVLIDNPMQLIDAIIPEPSINAKVQALKEAEKLCFSYGLTTVNDAGLDRALIELIDSLQQRGELSIRIYAMISSSKENLDYYLDRPIFKTEKLNVRSVKVYADGALGSRGAVLKETYFDKKGHYGAMVTPTAEIKKIAQRIAASKYQMNTHAIGDSANAFVLRVYDGMLKKDNNRRWKIEHAQVIDGEDFDYFEKGIIPSVQPTHATSDMYWVEERLGSERIKGAYAYKKLLDKAGVIALGTDFPVEQVSPFLTFYAAVSRKDVEGYPEKGFQINDVLSREEALKGMTIWAAYSNFEENEKGSIAVGKFADFIIYDKDIMTVSANEIPTIMAEQTYVGGVAY